MNVIIKIVIQSDAINNNYKSIHHLLFCVCYKMYFQALQYRAGNSKSSPALDYFRTYCLPRDISVCELINDLENIGNIACKNVLCTWVGKFS